MFTLRCTQRLLARSKVKLATECVDRTFIAACLRIMVARTAERAAGRAPRAHRWGWGSADAAAGAGALAERLLSAKAAYGDQKRVVARPAKYTVQIAEALRLAAMEKRPELADTAKVYVVAPAVADLLVTVVD